MKRYSNKNRVTLTRYCSRIDYLKDKCRDKKVLHLGCSSGRCLGDRVQRGSLLHSFLQGVASELHGVDIDAESLETLRKKLGFGNLYEADVQKLDQLELDEKFDVVIAGDLLEHITCPGAMLDGVRRFLAKDGQFVVSTNNAFGLHYQIKRWLGRYTEHFEHVSFFSPETLMNQFERHHYRVDDMFGAYTEPPHGWKSKLLFTLGVPVFSLFPVLAGTIIVEASLE